MNIILHSTLFVLLQFNCLILYGQNENKIKVYPAIEELYLKCGNKLKVYIDSIPSDKKLRFTLEGGTIRIGKGINEIFIYPTNTKVVLHVFLGDQIIGNKEFKVQKTFKPNIVFLADNKIINNGTISRNTKTIQLKAVCDSAFACVCPNDNTYKISYKVFYIQNEKPLKISESITNFGSLKLKYLKKADSILIELSTVKKLSYNNEEIDLKFEKIESSFLLY